MADSEEGRGELYADVIPGGYDVVPMTPPFSPQAYVAAIEEIENSGASIGIIDSGSHEWAGIGGVLDMAAENEDKSGRAGLHNWKVPKFEHAKFVQKLLRSKIPLIICLRAKFKTRQSKDERGKTVIIKDDHTEPIQADDFIFESTCHGEVMPDHSFRLTKCSHPDLRKCFPSEGPITSHHGELLAQWCAAPSAAPTKPKTVTLPAKSKLWEITKSIHAGDPGELESWLKLQNIISHDRKLSAIQPDEWTVILEKAEIAISDVMP